MMIENEETLMVRGLHFTIASIARYVSKYIPPSVARMVTEYLFCNPEVFMLAAPNYSDPMEIEFTICDEKWQCTISENNGILLLLKMQKDSINASVDFGAIYISILDFYLMLIGESDELIDNIEKEYRDKVPGRAIKAITHLMNVDDRLAREFLARFNAIEREKN